MFASTMGHGKPGSRTAVQRRQTTKRFPMCSPTPAAAATALSRNTQAVCGPVSAPRKPGKASLAGCSIGTDPDMCELGTEQAGPGGGLNSGVPAPWLSCPPVAFPSRPSCGGRCIALAPTGVCSSSSRGTSSTESHRTESPRLLFCAPTSRHLCLSTCQPCSTVHQTLVRWPSSTGAAVTTHRRADSDRTWTPG